MSTELSPRAAKFLDITVKLVQSAEANPDIGTRDLLIFLGALRRHETERRFTQQPMPKPCWEPFDQFIHIVSKLRRAGGLLDDDLERLESAIEDFAAQRYTHHLATLPPDKALLYGAGIGFKDPS